MKIDWIPDGSEADYDPVGDITNMAKIVDEFNKGVKGKLGELEANVKEFNKKAGELEGK